MFLPNGLGSLFGDVYNMRTSSLSRSKQNIQNKANLNNLSWILHINHALSNARSNALWKGKGKPSPEMPHRLRGLQKSLGHDPDLRPQMRHASRRLTIPVFRSRDARVDEYLKEDGMLEDTWCPEEDILDGPVPNLSPLKLDWESTNGGGV